MQFSSAQDVYGFLNQFLNFERRLAPTEYRLDRMHQLQRDFGWPDRDYRCFHVAGSKGKGSTATMLASILAQGDGPVGLFTSPHLLSFTERIAIDGRPVSDDILLPAAAELAAGMAGHRPEDFPGGEAPTFFELLTILAFLAFRRAGCAQAVIEVGLGGRLDSTNIILPRACLITPIELEHTEILGDTIEKIAAEKAGIIKPGVPVYTSAVRPAALAVIEAKAGREGAPYHSLDDCLELSQARIDRSGSRAGLSTKTGQASVLDGLSLHIPMIGQVQLRNAALAAMAAADAGYDRSRIEAGLSQARLRARFEIIPASAGLPDIILDGAHTEDSVLACVQDFKSIYPEGGVLLFGCAKDKDPRRLAAVFGPEIRQVMVTRPGTFKESDPQAIAAAFADRGYSCSTETDSQAACALAATTAAGLGLPLLVCGSFYLCAEMAQWLLRR